MTSWNEDNFLDRMAALPNSKGSGQACPDHETLCAVVDGVAGEPIRRAVAAHLVQCPSCAELEQRLRAFSQDGPVGRDPEWQAAERRLNRWMDDLVRPNLPAAAPGPPP